VIAAHTTLPVIGVPIPSTSLQGMDSLLAIVQMPAGIPVATVAIGKPGATNAGILAAQIIGVADAADRQKAGRLQGETGCKGRGGEIEESCKAHSQKLTSLARGSRRKARPLRAALYYSFKSFQVLAELARRRSSLFSANSTVAFQEAEFVASVVAAAFVDACRIVFRASEARAGRRLAAVRRLRRESISERVSKTAGVRM
jgi:hypothetical protein